MKIELTEKDIREYIEADYPTCPFCGDENRADVGCESSDIEIAGPVVYECYGCEGKWEITYKMANMRVLLQPKKEAQP